MNEKPLSAILSVPALGTELQHKVAVPDNAGGELIRENNSLSANRPLKRIEKPVEQINNLTNISIHFNVEQETNRLIVIVTDRQTGQIVRTIPASELEKMQAGDLLKLTA